MDKLWKQITDVLYPLPTHQVAIDLNDGVKVNYAMFGAALLSVWLKYGMLRLKMLQNQFPNGVVMFQLLKKDFQLFARNTSPSGRGNLSLPFLRKEIYLHLESLCSFYERY